MIYLHNLFNNHMTHKLNNSNFNKDFKKISKKKNFCNTWKFQCYSLRSLENISNGKKNVINSYNIFK